jgi:hypothetical protein
VSVPALHIILTPKHWQVILKATYVNSRFLFSRSNRFPYFAIIGYSYCLLFQKKKRRKKIERIKSQLDFYPFNKHAAVKYHNIRARLEKQGQPISQRDLQIAGLINHCHRPLCH